MKRTFQAFSWSRLGTQPKLDVYRTHFEFPPFFRIRCSYPQGNKSTRNTKKGKCAGFKTSKSTFSHFLKVHFHVWVIGGWLVFSLPSLALCCVCGCQQPKSSLSPSPEYNSTFGILETPSFPPVQNYKTRRLYAINQELVPHAKSPHKKGCHFVHKNKFSLTPAFP